MKRSTSRRFLSLLTVLALVMSLVVTVSAADTTLTRGELAALLVEKAGYSSQLAE